MFIAGILGRLFYKTELKIRGKQRLLLKVKSYKMGNLRDLVCWPVWGSGQVLVPVPEVSSIVRHNGPSRRTAKLRNIVVKEMEC